MKKLLVIGAGFLQSFVIREAKKIGYETLTVDADPNAIGFQYADKHEVIDIVDKKACLAYAQKEKIDGVLTAATDYGVLTAAYIAEQMNLVGLDYEVAKLIKNKYRVRKCLFEAKVDDMDPAYEVDESADIDFLAEKLSFPVMVKPCDGSGSRGVSRVDNASQFADACKDAISASITRRAEVETFISGQEYGAECIVVNGVVHVLGIMKKWMTKPPHYAELGHAMPSGLDKDVENKVIECVKKAINTLGINFGSVNMDILVTENNKVYIVDIGARMGGNLIGSHIILYGTGIDYMGNMIKSAMGEKVDLLPVAKPTVVETRLLALKSGKVTALPDFKKIESEYGVEIYHHLEIGQTVREYHTNLDGCGYIVAKADDTKTAIEKADKVLSLIKNTIFSID